MRSLTDKYPTTIKTPTGDWKICTDYRDWIRFSEMLKTNELTDEEKLYIASQYFLREHPCDAMEALIGLCSFYARKSYEDTKRLFRPSKKKATKKPSFDFEVDADCIEAGFLATYNVDLDSISYLHWHKFMGLLENLPEGTEFRHRVAARNTNLAKIKDADERARLRQYLATINIAEAPSDEDIGSLFW